MLAFLAQEPITHEALINHSTSTIPIVLIAFIVGLAVMFWRATLTLVFIVIVTLMIYGAVTLVEVVQT